MAPGDDCMGLLYEGRSGSILMAYRRFAANLTSDIRHEPAMSVHGTKRKSAASA